MPVDGEEVAQEPLEECLGIIAEEFRVRPDQIPPRVIAAVTSLALGHGWDVQHSADHAAAITLRAPPPEDAGKYSLSGDIARDEVTRVESVHGRRRRRWPR